MKKFIIGLIIGLNLGLFFGTTLHAQDFDNNADLIKQTTDDLRNIEIDDIECQKNIIEFYELIKNKEQNFTEQYKDDVSLRYKNCILKKQEHNQSVILDDNQNIVLDNKEDIIIDEQENIDEECKNKVMSFFGIFVENNEKSINLTKEYKDCVAKKQNGERIKTEKEQEKAVNLWIKF